MNKYRVLLSDAAAVDVEALADYIALTLREPATARQQTARLRAAVTSLDALPARQPLVRDAYLASRGIRMLPADGYLIFYTIQEETKTVHILRIVHGKREWNALLP